MLQTIATTLILFVSSVALIVWLNISKIQKVTVGKCYDKNNKHHLRSRIGLFLRVLNFLSRMSNLVLHTHYGIQSTDTIIKDILNKFSAKDRVEIPDFMREAIELKVECFNNKLNSEALQGGRISVMGSFIMKEDTQEYLQVYINLQNYLKTHQQEIQQAPDIDQLGPIFIVGLPRTGTTALHHFLALDPRNRSYTPWEMSSPYQITGKDKVEYQKNLKQVQFLFPGLVEDVEDPHFTGFYFPVDSALIWPASGYSIMLEYVIDSQKYTNWRKQPKNIQEMLKIHRQSLQVLLTKFAPKEGGNIVLKCPAYTNFLDHIALTYPNCKFVFTHRDPVALVPSTCKILHPVHEMYEDYCDLAREGASVNATIHEMLDNMVTQRKHLQLEFNPLQLQGNNKATTRRHVDVHMNQLTKDPVGVIRAIYQTLGLGNVTEEHEKRVVQMVDGIGFQPGTSKSLSSNLHSPWALSPAQLAKEYAEYSELLKRNFPDDYEH